MTDHNPSPSELAQQLAQEREALRNAPKVTPILGPIVRCWHCGQVADKLTLVEIVATPHGAAERFKCHKCSGGHHA